MPSINFFITSLIVVLIPGTGVIFTISTGLFQGWRASIFAALGCTAGITPHLLAIILGLAALLHMSAVAFHLVKFVGVVYLLYLAWSMWKQTGAFTVEIRQDSKDAARIVLKGFLINILNPKLSLFFLAFLPQFVPSEIASPIAYMLVLSSIFMAMTLGVFILYGLFAHKVRAYIVNAPGVMRMAQRSFSIIFAMLGTKLAMAER